MNLFWKQGYHATSAQDLVDTLGISRSSLYDTFGDKEQLFERAFAQYREENLRGIRLFLAGQPEVRTGLRELFSQAIEEIARDEERKGCFVVNITTEFIPGDEKMEQLLVENRRNFEQVFYDYLKSGEEKGQFAAGKDLRALASLLFTLYNGLKVVGKVDPDPGRLERSVDLVLQMLD